jgi:endonuclease/exonuclease/phosphatase family metal-dependent hydrolase
MKFRTISALAFLLPTVLIGTTATASAANPQIKVMTYNTHHGGDGSSARLESQLDTIAAQNPDVVLLQEAYSSQLDTYVRGLNARQNTTAWHGVYNKTCKAGVEPTCKTYTSESVMILTRLKTVATTPRLIWAKDSYHVARATLRMAVALADGTQVNVFAAHLPALVAYAPARVTYVNTFKTWSASFAGPKVVGGDFNERPTEQAVIAMAQQFNDAWAVGGSGSGYTHVKDGTTTLYRRIDYLFFDKSSGLNQTGVKVVGRVSDSDHVGVVATYTVPSTAAAPVATTTPTVTTTPAVTTAPAVTTSSVPGMTTPTVPAAPIVPATTQTTLFADKFDAVDATQWPTRVITGTQDSTIALTVAGGTFQIGALKNGVTGAHYNGISSAAYNLSNHGCAAVQLAQGLNPSTAAYAMFAVVRDTNNLYRWYQSGDALIAESKIGGVKKALVDLQYSATTHQFLRIRKETNLATGTQDVVFETAASNNGVPGVYTERYRNTWAASVNASGLKVEIKAGTSGAEAGAGSAYWDNVLVATNCQ